MSDRFSIEGIEDVFRDDVIRLTSTIRARAEELQSDPRNTEALEDVRTTGHSLKGAASLVGLDALSRCGASIEQLADVVAGLEGEPARDLAGRITKSLDVVERLVEASLQRVPEEEERIEREFQQMFPELGGEGAAASEEAGPSEEPAPVEGVAAEAGGDAGDDEEEFNKELAEIFALELQEHLQDVPSEVQLLPPADTRPAAAHRLNRIFHTIKGSAAMVGLTDLSASAKYLEKFFEDPARLESDEINEAQAKMDEVFRAADTPGPSMTEAFAEAPQAAPAAESELERELLEAFSVDAQEGIEQIEQLLLDLEHQPGDRELLNALFRQFHTLKGAAGAVGLDVAGAQLHHGESLLEDVLEGERQIDGGRLVDFLFRLSDSVVALINQARGIQDPRREVMSDVEGAIRELREAAVTAPAAEVPAAAPAEAPSEPVRPAAEAPAAEMRAVPESEAGVVRVQAGRLDALLNQVGQLVVSRTRMDEKVQSFAELRERLEYCRTRLTETIEGFQKRFEFTVGDSSYPMPTPLEGGGRHDQYFTDLEFDKYDDFNILARSVIELASDTGEVADQLEEYIDALGEEVREFSKITSGLQRQITNLRLVPIDVVFRRLLRPVRDVARQEGKLVDLQFSGSEVQLDRGVVDALYTPLLHIVRNAVSHGIEAPGVREVKKKPRMGTVRITAASRHNSVTITAADDGAGIDYDGIFNKAVRLKLVDPTNPPPREQLLSMIFRPGFSTAETVTDVSGRGVGMDVVARQIANLNGSVLIDSKPGEGTTLRLALPITTSIDEVLVLEVGEQVYALPVDYVERVIAIDMADVEESGSQFLVQVGEDEQLAALFLGPLIDEPLPPAQAVGVVLRAGERAFVLVIDSVRGQQEVVIRPLNRLLERHPFLSATTLSGAGAIIFVLHVGRLFDILSAGAESYAALEPGRGPSEESVMASRGILVVDDSISVRKLAERFLQSEGLDVDTAVDGLDALEKLGESHYRVVVTDLEMPRMNGYDLTEAIKANPKLSHLPVIVCTSRASEKHRVRAREAGADGYITKPFTREELVAEIMRVTEWARPAVAEAEAPASS